MACGIGFGQLFGPHRSERSLAKKTMRHFGWPSVLAIGQPESGSLGQGQSRTVGAAPPDSGTTAALIDVAIAVQDLAAKQEALRELFESRIRSDEVQGKALERLHDQVQEYKTNFVRQQMLPLLRDLIYCYDFAADEVKRAQPAPAGSGHRRSRADSVSPLRGLERSQAGPVRPVRVVAASQMREPVVLRRTVAGRCQGLHGMRTADRSRGQVPNFAANGRRVSGKRQPPGGPVGLPGRKPDSSRARGRVASHACGARACARGDRARKWGRPGMVHRADNLERAGHDLAADDHVGRPDTREGLAVHRRSD